MLKGILVGLLVGGAATAGVLKFLDARKAGAPAGGDAAAAPAPAADPHAKLREDIAARKAANEELRKTAGARKADLAALAATGGEADKAAPKPARSWKDIAPKLLKLAALMKDPEAAEAADRAELESVWLDVFAMMGEIAKAKGLSIDEAILSPDGLPALLLAALEAGDKPLSEEQKRDVDALLAKYREDWAGLAGDSEGKTRLERRLAMTEASEGFNDALTGLLTTEQAETGTSLAMFGMLGAGMGGMHWANGTREEVTENLTGNWLKQLKLDAAAKPLVRSIVEDYMLDCEEAQKLAMAPGAKNETLWKDIQREQLKAQVKAQKKLAALPLTPEQKAALEGWTTHYGFSVNQGAAPVPPEPAVEGD